MPEMTTRASLVGLRARGGVRTLPIWGRSNCISPGHGDLVTTMLIIHPKLSSLVGTARKNWRREKETSPRTPPHHCVLITFLSLDLLQN